MHKQNLNNETNPTPDIFTITREEAGPLYRNLSNLWLNRDDNFELVNETVKRLGRFVNGSSSTKS